MTSPTFCPTCQAALHERPVLDPNLTGYACESDDRFYTTTIEQVGGIPTADTIRPPALSDDLHILKFWLTDPAARRRIPNQLGVVCRRIIDICEHRHRVARVQHPFSFCPACREALARFESDDVYLQGLRCGNGHEFWERGGTVYYVDHGRRTTLSAELNDEDLSQFLAYYTGDNEHITPHVHPQLRDALKRLWVAL